MIWLGIVVCFLISFVFSGIEAGILSVNRIRLKHRVKTRDPAAIKLNRLLRRPERLLVTVLIVTNLMNIFAITLATQEIVRALGNRGYFVSLAIFLPLYLLGVELLPKSLFRRFPYRSLAALAEPLRIADLLLAPLHVVGKAVARVVASQRAPEQQKLFSAREEFKYLTIESERTGTLSKAERQMIHNVVDFRAILAQDVMVPIEQVRTIPAQATVSELIVQGSEINIDRWPVTSPTGEIVGLVNIFDLALDPRRQGTVQTYQRRIVKVAPDEPGYSILRKLRAARISIAAVVGANSKPLGIVTWEELIKRLVSTAAG